MTTWKTAAVGVEAVGSWSRGVVGGGGGGVFFIERGEQKLVGAESGYLD